MTTSRNVEADLGWALGAVTRNYLRAADEVLSDVPGGPRGYQVLVTVSREGCPRTQLGLAQQLGLDRTVMTYLLDDLQKAGLVERRLDPADRRARRVELTETGRELLCGLREQLHKAEERLLDRLDPAERSTLRDLLHRLATGSTATGSELCEVASEIDDGAC